MFWLRYSCCIEWTSVTDESNTDHDKGTKNKDVYKASVNLLSSLFSSFFFLSLKLFSYFSLPFSFFSLLCLSLFCLRVFCFRRWWCRRPLLLLLHLLCMFSSAFSVALSVYRCVRARDRERERAQAYTRLFDCSFFSPSYCCLYTYIVHLIQWLTEVT